MFNRLREVVTLLERDGAICADAERNRGTVVEGGVTMVERAGETREAVEVSRRR